MAGFADQINWSFVAGLAGVVFILHQTRTVQKKQDEIDEQSIRIPQYFSTGDNQSEFIPARKVYKDGPITWVAEASDGTKWIQYSNSTARPPSLLRKYVMQI